MSVEAIDLEIGKEYLAVGRRDDRNEVGAIIKCVTANGWIQVEFTRGIWRTVFHDYKRGDSLALRVEFTDFFEMPRFGDKKCQKCPARIIFLETDAGKKMPVNAETVMPKDRMYDKARHTVHWSTCASADSFKPKPKEEPHHEPKQEQPAVAKPERPTGRGTGRRGDTGRPPVKRGRSTGGGRGGGDELF